MDPALLQGLQSNPRKPMTQATTPRRALIVVDVQNIYADGPLLIEYPPVQDSLVRIGQAMDAAHAAGIPIAAATSASRKPPESRVDGPLALMMVRMA